MPVIAVAYMCRLNPHSIILLMCRFMLISVSLQCFTLLETWDYGIFRGEQKDIPCLSGTHTLRRHILPDQAKLQKRYLWYFICSFILPFCSHHAGLYLLVDWLLKKGLYSLRVPGEVSALYELSQHWTVGNKIFLQWLSISNTAHTGCKNILCCLKMSVPISLSRGWHIFPINWMENSFCLISNPFWYHHFQGSAQAWTLLGSCFFLRSYQRGREKENGKTMKQERQWSAPFWKN